MSEQNIDLLNTLTCNFNNNEVKNIILNNEKIWGEPFEHIFDNQNTTLGATIVSSTSNTKKKLRDRTCGYASYR